MFRASIYPSSGVLGCIRIMLFHMVSALGVVAEVLRSRCVVLCTGVSFVSLVNFVYDARTHIHQMELFFLCA